MLPCTCNKEVWDILLQKFNTRLRKEGKKEDSHQLNEILTIRSDGIALLEGPIIKEFKFSKDGVKALELRKALSEKNYSKEEIIQKIATTFKISSFQVDTFFRRVEKWIGSAEYRFIKSKPPIDEHLFNIPLLIQWEITAECNLKCIHCYANTDGAPASDELTTEEIISFINEYAVNGGRGIHFLGGEPFIRPDILHILKKSSELGLFSHVSTNGTLITQELANKLASLKRTTIDVSLDGVCPKSHDSFRGVKGTFDRVLHSLDLLREAGVTINVTTVLGKHNFTELEKLVETAVDFGAKRIQFLTFSPVGRGSEAQKKYGFNEKQLKIVRKKIFDTIFEYWDIIYIDAPMIGCNPLALRTYEVLNFPGFELYYDLLVGCNAGISKATIDFTGNVFPCPQVRKSFGNIRNENFLTIWNNLHSFCLKNKVCSTKNCPLERYCGGKCRINS